MGTNHTLNIDDEIWRRLLLAAKATDRSPTKYIERAIKNQISDDIDTGEIPNKEAAK